MSPEAALVTALDGLAEPAVLWWRDDDAGRDHPRLRRLLALASRRAAPLALAVVPDWLEPAAADAILACGPTTVLQHGIAHTDHAPAGAKKIELGGSADPVAVLAGLRRGRERLARAFGHRFLPVLVPPWNRIDGSLLPRLPGLGFLGLSCFGRHDSLPALRQVDAQLDLVAWREGRRPLRLDEAVAGLGTLLRGAAGGPVGLLSHHLVADDAAFDTLDRLLAVVQDHRNARLVGAGPLFGSGG